jgi:hypothetical protein
MKLKKIAARVCVCSIGAVALYSELWAGPDSDAVRQFGLVGVWRVDCTKPVDIMTNWEVVFAAPEHGLPTMAGYWSGLLELRDVRIIAPDRLTYSHMGNSGQIVSEMVKQNGRIFNDLVVVKGTGKVLFKDGINAETGEGSPTLEPCQAKVSALPGHNAPR